MSKGVWDRSAVTTVAYDTPGRARRALDQQFRRLGGDDGPPVHLTAGWRLEVRESPSP